MSARTLAAMSNTSKMQTQQLTIKPSPATMKAAQAGSALKTAGASTMNPTMKLPPAGGADAGPVWVQIGTVWDAPLVVGNQTKKLEALGTGVTKMTGAFQDITRMKEEKRAMMTDMHEHALERVAATRVEMEDTLAELAAHIKAFCEEWEQTRTEAMDKMDLELQQRVAKIAARFDRLDGRAGRLQVAIDEERAARIKSTQEIVIPARKSVEVLQETIEKERQTREHRERELSAHLEETVAMLERNVVVEKEKRVVRHEEFVKECEIELNKLAARQVRIGASNEEIGVSLHRDLEQEKKLRVDGQDHIVEQITMFIHKFQAHIREEGEMGN